MSVEASSAIQAYLQSRRGEMLGLVEELVRIESYASQADGVNAVGDVLCGELEANGFTTERARGQRVGPEERWLEEIMLPGYDPARLGDHRVARKAGAGRGRILILGDMDTAFPPGATARFRFSVSEGRAYGPGIADMKGGLATAVYALKALEENGLNNLGEVTCVFSADEQAGSLTVRNVIELAAREADWAFCMECARDGGNLMASRAQIGVGRLEVRGREAHAGSAFNEGISAIEAMARKITAIHALTDPARETYLCVGQVSGGWRRSVIAGSCVATIDARTPSQEAWNAVEAALRRIADTVELPGSSASLQIASHRPAVPWTTNTDRLLEIAREAGSELGLHFGAIRSPAAGSSAFTGPLGVPCLDGMGPVGAGLMTDKEHVLATTLVDRAALLATMMHKLGAGAWERA